MHLLLIHNNYGVYSGEEMVVDQQTSLFRKMGYMVSFYRKTTEGARGTIGGNIRGILQGFYAPGAVRDIRKIMRENRPDVVVIHNLYPYISPAILKYIKKAGVPIVMTVHNFRLMCPTGLFMRNTRPCELCLKGKEWNCIRYNCEHSMLKSLGYAGRNWYARVTKAYINHVDVYACITTFQTQKLIEAGYAPEKMRVIPNFINERANPDFQVEKQGKYVAVSGRISREKGFDLLLEVARKTPEISYVFAGTIRPEDKDLINNPPSNCTFPGHLSKTQLSDFYQNSRFLVIASHWYEGFPMTILEAASYGKPAIGPGHAGFLEIIDNYQTGLHFVPSDVDDLQEKITWMWNHSKDCVEMGRRAFDKLKANYTEEAVRKKWDNLLRLVSRTVAK